MDERRTESRRAIVIVVALVSLLSLGAVLAPSFRPPAAVAVDAAPAPPVVSRVEVWLSTADHRLKLARQSDLVVRPNDASPADIAIDASARYQTMVGFGAAMTDASAWLLHTKLDAPRRRELLRELYGPPPNLNLDMMRLTIGASDFSLRLYTLDDIPFGQTDPTLRRFDVTANEEDVIPVVQEAMAIEPDLFVVASPWTAPAWMKTNENLIGGELQEQYESVYADYLVKYVDTYRGHGIPIAALTLQNEPAFSPISYPGMLMGPEQRARIVAKYLGPKLAGRRPPTRILDWDHNWSHPEQPLAVLGDPAAARYVDGVAWHCYEGSQHEQGRVHRAHPDKNTYITECSGGDWELSVNGELLWFSRNLLVTGIRQWAKGAIYWNLALDENHGPHFGGCALCKGIVTIDSQTGAVTRNDEYYAIAHFSKFVTRGAVRLKSTDTDAEKNIANVAFQNESDDAYVLVLVNINKKARPVSIAQGANRIDYDMPAESVATLVWNRNPAGAWIRRVLQWLGPSQAPAIAE